MKAIAVVLISLFLTSYGTPILSEHTGYGDRQNITMTMGDLWYVSSLREVCLQVNLIVPPGILNVFSGSDLRLSKGDGQSLEIHRLNQNTCLWNEEGRLNIVGGHTYFVTCSNGFGKNMIPRDEVSIFGRVKVHVECPRFLTQCRREGEAMEGTHVVEHVFELETITQKIKKVMYHDPDIVNPCSMGVTPQPCHDCATTCNTLLFGGNRVRCNGWWKALSLTIHSHERIVDVREDCMCTNKL